jgi:hypothetical protein
MNSAIEAAAEGSREYAECVLKEANHELTAFTPSPIAEYVFKAEKFTATCSLDAFNSPPGLCIQQIRDGGPLETPFRVREERSQCLKGTLFVSIMCGWTEMVVLKGGTGSSLRLQKLSNKGEGAEWREVGWGHGELEEHFEYFDSQPTTGRVQLALRSLPGTFRIARSDASVCGELDLLACDELGDSGVFMKGELKELTSRRVPIPGPLAFWRMKMDPFVGECALDAFEKPPSISIRSLDLSRSGGLKGSFGSPFEISERDAAPLCGEFHVILPCTAEETKALRSGCVFEVERLNVETNSWERQPIPVRLEYPKAERVRVTLVQFSCYRLVPVAPSLPFLDEDRRFSRDWTADDPPSVQRNGLMYHHPIGFRGTALRLERFDESGNRAFHGVRWGNVPEIVRYGLKIPDVVPSKGHLPRLFRFRDIDEFAGAIFVSSSWRYAGMYSSRERLVARGPGIECWVTSGDFEDDRIILTLLQVNVRAGSFQMTGTTLSEGWRDPLVANSVIEWRVPRPEDVSVYRVLRISLTAVEEENWVRARWEPGSPDVPVAPGEDPSVGCCLIA